MRAGVMCALLLFANGVAALAAPVTVPARNAAPGGKWQATVRGFASGGGAVRWAVFASEDGFPMEFDQAVTSGAVAVTGTVVQVAIDLPAGRWAVSLYHDADGDGALRTGFLGIPRECVAVSNNATGRFGPPKFRDAVFELTPGQVLRQTLSLNCL